MFRRPKRSWMGFAPSSERVGALHVLPHMRLSESEQQEFSEWIQWGPISSVLGPQYTLLLVLQVFEPPLQFLDHLRHGSVFHLV